MSGRRLVVDAGGTNVRFAMADGRGQLNNVQSYRVADYPAFTDALEAYRAQVGGFGSMGGAAIAAAGPVDGDRVKITNNPWSIDRSALAAQMGGIPIALVNDLEAVAAALPHLSADDVTRLGGAVPVPAEGRTMLAVNVGTGFGAASVSKHDGAWRTCPTEAGHMSLGVTSSERDTLAGDASVEGVLSGNGLARLYHQFSGGPGPAIDASIVLAKAGSDPAARRAVDAFGDVLARIAGDLTLATCAWGGAYLCGSVAVGWSAVGDHERFRAAFTRKGAMRERMQRVPAAVIRRDNVALLGLAMMPLSA